MRIHIIGSSTPYMITNSAEHAETYRDDISPIESLDVEGNAYLRDILGNDKAALTVKICHIAMIELKGSVIFYYAVDGTKASFVYTSGHEAGVAFKDIVGVLRLEVN